MAKLSFNIEKMHFSLAPSDSYDVNYQMQEFGQRRGRTCIAAV